MAELNPNLLLTMIDDLKEIHFIGMEMLERVGKCEVKSWRFPNQCVQDIQINTLLNDIEPETPDKYILLLELIIDRLYFIINLTLELFDTLPQISDLFRLPKNIYKQNCISFGILMSFFWKRLQVLLENNTLHFASGDDRTDQMVTASQTDIRLFLNCDSCYSAMETTKTLIKGMEECMSKLKLQSVISKQRLIIERSLPKLSQFGAMQQWTEAIVIDAQSLIEFSKRKSLENLDLIEDFQNMKKENDKSLKKCRYLQVKYDELEKLHNEDQSKIKLLTNIKQELEPKCNKLMHDLNLSCNLSKTNEQKIYELENTTKQVEQKNKEKIMELKIEQAKQLEAVNLEKKSWTEMYMENKKYVEELEEKMKLERTKQNEIQTNLQEKFEKEKEQIEFCRIQAENRSKLLQEKFDQLEKQMQRLQSETKVQQCKKEQEVKNLNEELLLHKEREDILLRCPDLNGPILKIQNEHVLKNPIEDMEQQIAANELRASLLHNQNNSLRRTVDKMKALMQKK